MNLSDEEIKALVYYYKIRLLNGKRIHKVIWNLYT